MNCLQENKILKYHPNTLSALRRKYNLHQPGDMDKAIDLLNDWIQKQEHFTKKDFPRDYLERLIIQLKGSVERTKSQLDRLCTLRTIIPQFFEKCDVNKDLIEIKEYALQALLPNMTDDYYRIYFTKFPENGGHTSRKLYLYYIYSAMICEYIKSHDYCDGTISIGDFRNVNITEFISELNLNEMRQMATISLQGYSTRIKGIHIISNSNTINLLVKIFKQMLSEKVSNRVHVHKSVDDLYEFVPKKLLPKDYGGEEKSLKELNDDLFDAIGSEENVKLLKSMKEARTNESLRSVAKFNEQYLGMPGTFRSFNVD